MGRTRKAQGSSGAAVVLLLFVGWIVGQCSPDSKRVGPDGTRTQPSTLSQPAAPAVSTLPESKVPDFRYVDTASLKLRVAPNGGVIGRLARGQEVSIGETSGGWSKVTVDDGQSGWIALRYTCATAGCWRRAGTAAPSKGTARPLYGSSCPCSGPTNCYGPRGGRYCITSGGNKRYR